MYILLYTILYFYFDKVECFMYGSTRMSIDVIYIVHVSHYTLYCICYLYRIWRYNATKFILSHYWLYIFYSHFYYPNQFRKWECTPKVKYTTTTIYIYICMIKCEIIRLHIVTLRICTWHFFLEISISETNEDNFTKLYLSTNQN